MNKKILIVEDEMTLSRALEITFQHEKFQIIKAINGEEGLVKALAEHPDVILLDIIMPKMDGLTMLKNLREDAWGKDVPVILLTNLSGDENVQAALDKGVYDYLVKTDWNLSDIVNVVKSRLNIA